MPTPTTLYAWARPLSIAPFFDHTWVTDYQPASDFSDINQVVAAGSNVWYCHGDFHDNQYRLLGTATGDAAQSSCIARPNDETAYGTIFRYGWNGVCHQVANQVLYSTITFKPDPEIVAGANGYRISSFLYRTYGRPDSRWRALASKCVVVHSILSGMDDFVEHVMSFATMLTDDGSLDRLMALRDEFSTTLEVMATEAAAIANPEEATARINDLITQTMSRAAEILGPERYFMIFEHEAYAPVPLVDPEIMARHYEQLGGPPTP